MPAGMSASKLTVRAIVSALSIINSPMSADAGSSSFVVQTDKLARDMGANEPEGEDRAAKRHASCRNGDGCNNKSQSLFPDMRTDAGSR